LLTDEVPVKFNVSESAMHVEEWQTTPESVDSIVLPPVNAPLLDEGDAAVA
jgi:hypothetical protein